MNELPTTASQHNNPNFNNSAVAITRILAFAFVTCYVTYINSKTDREIALNIGQDFSLTSRPVPKNIDTNTTPQCQQ